MAFDAYKTNKNGLRQQLGKSFVGVDDDDLFCVFSMIIAYSLAPYGKSFKTNFNDILHEPTIACNGYAIAMGHFVKIYKTRNIKIYYVGWHGGVIGNHVQIFTVNSSNGVKLLLDPTIALVAITNYDHVAAGKKISKSFIVDFSAHSNSELNSFLSNVKNSLLQGKYKPSDLLYCFDDIDLYTYENSKIINNIKDWLPSWPTFGAIKQRSEIQRSRNTSY